MLKGDAGQVLVAAVAAAAGVILAGLASVALVNVAGPSSQPINQPLVTYDSP